MNIIDAISHQIAAVIQQRSVARLSRALPNDVCLDFAFAIVNDLQTMQKVAALLEETNKALDGMPWIEGSFGQTLKQGDGIGRTDNHGYDPQPARINEMGFVETSVKTTIYMGDGSVKEAVHQEVCGELEDGA